MMFFYNFSNIKLYVPRTTRRNGTLFMHTILLDDNRLYKDFNELIHTESVHTFSLITHIEPQAETFNLLQHQVNINNVILYNNLILR